MRKIYPLLLFIAIPFFLAAQTKWEAGILLGLSNYQGDLVVKSPPLFREGNFAFSLQGKYVLNPQFSFRSSLTFTRLTGDDFNYTIRNRRGRGAIFKTSITEISVVTEWEPLGIKRYDSGAGLTKIISPYIFAGLGFSIIDPKPDFSRATVLDDITDGQRDLNAEYHKSHFVIPFGLGLKVDVHSYWYVAAEFGARFTFTDYLDGISIAGNPDYNDWYWITGLSIVHRLQKK